MKVLVVGSGGREHAICWKLRQSMLVDQIYSAPGNGGTAQLAKNVEIKADDLDGIVAFSRREGINLAIIGPEDPLSLGVVDRLREAGIPVFGPNAKAARLESDKIFSKELMVKYGIPTGGFASFDKSSEARAYLEGQPDAPIVVKAFGLAKGKGVYICPDRQSAMTAIDEIMDQRIFGAAGDRVLIEEMLEGPEASMMAISDGENVLPLVPAQDYKRVFDGDQGPNTGGMGCYSPVPVVTRDILAFTLDKILRPTVAAMAKEGCPYVGVLYAGIMLTEKGPKVLEYNCRFGDPETQVVLPRMRTDLVKALQAAIDGRLDEFKVDWYDSAAVSVVMTSEGYPGDYPTGIPVEGLREANAMNGVYVFHAGTRLEDGQYVTSGGRVVSVTGTGPDFRDAIANAYGGVDRIQFEGAHYRKDIGRRAIG